MKVLVTNDDGVQSTGLHVLARTLVDAGYDVVVAAPDGERSGSSAAIGHIGVGTPIAADPVALPLLDGVACYAVDGPPGLCVLAARLGGFGDPPDLVVSGINPGCNTGRAVLHSGTVGAALTAANFGVSGLAVSLDTASLFFHEALAGAGGRVPVGDGDEVVAEVVATPDGDRAGAGGGAGPVEGPEWQAAATVATSLVGWVAAAPPCTVLNVNVPNLPLDELKGVRAGELAPFGTVRTGVETPAGEGTGLQLQLRPTTDEVPPDSDTGLVGQGFVSVTALRGVGADPAVDLGDALAAAPLTGAGG
jgi:5'-nucleotidase